MGGDYCNVDGHLKTKEKNYIGKKFPIAPEWIKKPNNNLKNFIITLFIILT